MKQEEFNNHIRTDKKFNSVIKIKKLITKNIKYGWSDKNNYIYTIPRYKDNNLFMERYRLQKPWETYSSGYGICWDQALLINYIINELFDYDLDLIFTTKSNDHTHLFNMVDMGKYKTKIDSTCDDKILKFESYEDLYLHLNCPFMRIVNKFQIQYLLINDNLTALETMMFLGYQPSIVRNNISKKWDGLQ